jgi:hypothetical protein
VQWQVYDNLHLRNPMKLDRCPDDGGIRIIHTEHQHLFPFFIRILRHHKKHRLSDIFIIPEKR